MRTFPHLSARFDGVPADPSSSSAQPSRPLLIDMQLAPPLTRPTPPTIAIGWTRALAVASLLGLIVLGLAWELWLAPTGHRTLALKVLPLAVPLVGLLKRRMYTYRWVSLMVWLYFIEGVVRASGDHGIGRGLAVAETLLCLLLFAACAAHVHYRLLHPRGELDSGEPA